jgi:hypothetical protein
MSLRLFLIESKLENFNSSADSMLIGALSPDLWYKGLSRDSWDMSLLMIWRILDREINL